MESVIMRKTYEYEDRFFAFGIDKLCGVFLQIHNENEKDFKINNWSEFEPFCQRFTYDAIQDAIKNGELLKSDFKEICKIPIGDFNIYFSELTIKDDAPIDFEIPKRLMQKYYNGKPFRIKTLGDYYKVLKLFRIHLTFSKITWYPYSKRSTGVLYEFYK